MDTSVWWSGDLFSQMRATLSADRCREHLEAHARSETVVHSALRAEDVVRWATIGGAKALGLDDVVGSLTPGKRADIVLVKNDASPAMFPILQPFGHLVYQAGRGDVHTVMVDGRIVKSEHRLVGNDLDRAKAAVMATVEHTQRELGPVEWLDAMAPELPASEPIANPYTYTDWDGGRGAVARDISS
jgi:cytosine/adenosine deaminase-related metal-dependent hydrolase